MSTYLVCKDITIADYMLFPQLLNMLNIYLPIIVNICLVLLHLLLF